MALLNAGKQETVSFNSTINAGKQETFKLTNSIEAGKAETFSIVRTINASKAETFELLNVSLNASYNGSTVSGSEWLNYIAPNVQFYLTLTNNNVSEDLSPYIKRIVLRKQLDGRDTIDFSLSQYGTTFSNADTDAGAGLWSDMIMSLKPDKINPFYSGFSDSTGRLYAHNFTKRTTLKVRVKYGYDQTGYSEWNSPTYLPEEPTFDGETLEWAAGDLLGLLEQENRTMADINANVNQGQTAHSALAQILSTYGISSYVFNFPNFLIRMMRRSNGVPRDWVDEICNIYQCKINFSGDTCYIAPATPPNLGNAKWTLVADQHLEVGSFSAYKDLSEYRNRFTVSRLSPDGGIIGETECIGPQCVGRTVNITLDEEVNSLNVQSQAASGVITDFVYFDKFNNPVLPDEVYALGPSGPTYIGPTPVKRIEATYAATSGVGGPNIYEYNIGQLNTIQLPYVPRYSIQVYGKNPGQAGLDATYNFTVQDTDGITAFGLRPEYANIENELIPNSSVGLDHANALLKESTRKVWHCKFKTKWVNPRIEPGDIVTLSDNATNMSNVKWLVEEVTITHENGESSMELYCTRGRL